VIQQVAERKTDQSAVSDRQRSRSPGKHEMHGRRRAGDDQPQPEYPLPDAADLTADEAEYRSQRQEKYERIRSIAEEVQQPVRRPRPDEAASVGRWMVVWELIGTGPIADVERQERDPKERAAGQRGDRRQKRARSGLVDTASHSCR
jgi:hypothetical protein